MCYLGVSPESYNPKVLYVVKQRFNSQSSLAYHNHDFLSLMYIISGNSTYKINDEIYNVKVGDVIICNAGTYHGRMLEDSQEICEFHIGLTDLKLENLPLNHLTNSESPIITLTKYNQEFFKCYTDIILEQEKHEPGSDLIIKALVMKLVAILLKETYYIEQTGGVALYNPEYYDRSDLVNSIVAYINDNYKQNISLDKISKSMYLSPVYISKIFKEETGYSPINYLINVRLNKAKDLLKEGRLSIGSIASEVGYTDAYHFSKLYKKHFGYPPSQDAPKKRFGKLLPMT